MSLTHPETVTDAERMANAAERDAEAAYDRAADTVALAADAAQSNIAAHVALGDKIRHQADLAQLRLALRNLTEGVRGMIRVSPLSSVFLGVVIGIALGKRRIHRAKSPRRA